MVQLYQIKDDAARNKIGSVAGEQLDNQHTLLNDKFDQPLDATLSGDVITVEAGKKQKLESDGSDGTQNAYKLRLPPLGGVDLNPVQSTIDLTDGSVTGDFDSPAESKSMTASYWIQMGIELRDDGKLYVVWGDENAVKANTTFPPFNDDAIPVLMVFLQDSGGGGTWNYSTPAKSDIELFGAAGAGGGGGGLTAFKLKRMSGTVAVIGKGYWKMNDGTVLVSGSGTTEATMPEELNIDLSSIIGSPTTNTTYYLYVDRDTLSESTYTDNGRKVYKVSSASNFDLFTDSDDDVNSLRYVYVGMVRTVAASWTGALVETSAARTHDSMSRMFGLPEIKKSSITSAAASNVIAHGLSQEPQHVQLYFIDSSAGTKTALDLSSHLNDKDATNLDINTAGLTFDSGDSVEVVATYMPSLSNGSASLSHSFKSAWMENTSVTTLPHGLTDMEDIAGYEVQEWDVTAGKRKNIDRSGLVVNFDETNFYLDWTGITPSSTLKYRVVTGGSPLPQSAIHGTRNVFEFTDGTSLTSATTAYPVDIEPGDNVHSIRALQKTSNGWQTVDTIGALVWITDDTNHYLRGDISSLSPSSSNPVKIIVQGSNVLLNAHQDASATQSGVVTAGPQEFAGKKVFRSGYFKLLKKTTTYTASSGDHIAADTSSAAFQINLPASPSDMDMVEIFDWSGTFGSNNLTVSGNGKNIVGNSSVVINDPQSRTIFAFNSTTDDWRVF